MADTFIKRQIVEERTTVREREGGEEKREKEGRERKRDG